MLAPSYMPLHVDEMAALGHGFCPLPVSLGGSALGVRLGKRTRQEEMQYTGQWRRSYTTLHSSTPTPYYANLNWGGRGRLVLS